MMRAAGPLVLALALAGCGAPAGTSASQTATSEPTVAAATAPAPTPSVAASQAQAADYAPPVLTPEAAKGETGARNVLLSWAHAMNARAFAAAYALYSKNGPPDGQSAKDFAASFAAYKTIDVAIGDGEIEGAAGSSYYEVPVTLSGTTQDGSAYRREGTITLRRVNDVPGAEPWQLAWHIERIEWKN